MRAREKHKSENLHRDARSQKGISDAASGEERESRQNQYPACHQQEKTRYFHLISAGRQVRR
jgi:hypothetical protein